MKTPSLKKLVMISSKNIIGFIILFAFMIINPACQKDRTTTPTLPKEAISPTDKTERKTFHIGDSYGGGIIFYIDSTGKHGLISATKDTGDATGRMRWGSAAFITTGATGTAVGTGKANTKKIIEVQGQQYTYAALLCRKYRGGGHTDWFLPSKDELYLLYQQKSVVGGFVWGAYWSSSEFDNSLAWTKYFYNDLAQYSHKDRFNGVRAIRAF